MSSFCGQLIGWTPSGDGDQYDARTAPAPSQGFLNSPFSSSSSVSNPDSHPLRSSCPNPRHQCELGWVARPRNAFIIFRCDYSQIHRRRGRRIRRPPGFPSTDPSLSKRAATAWKQMTAEEKEPYRIRAKQERDDHVRNNPDYRFRPQRYPGTIPKSRFRLRSPLKSVTERKVGPPTNYSASRELFAVSTASSPTTSPSSTTGGSQTDVSYESQHSLNLSTRWIHPIACNASAPTSDSAKLPVEMMHLGHTAPHFNGIPPSETPCLVPTQPHLFRNGEIFAPPMATGTQTLSNTFATPPEVTDFFAPSSFAQSEGYYEAPYETLQHPGYAEGLRHGPTGSYLEQMAPGPYHTNWYDYAITNDYSNPFTIL